jgi:nucleoside 2-deoxyribosyltransferase
VNYGPYSPTKVYIAAPFEQREAAIALKAELVSRGVVVTSTWLTDADSASMDALKKKGPDGLFCDARLRAIEDFKNIDEADFFILFKLPAWHRKPTTGGHHVETGYAQAKGKPIIIFGGRENVFHYRPGVHEAEDLLDLFEALGLPATFRVVKGVVVEEHTA